MWGSDATTCLSDGAQRQELGVCARISRALSALPLTFSLCGAGFASGGLAGRPDPSRPPLVRNRFPV